MHATGDGRLQYSQLAGTILAHSFEAQRLSKLPRMRQHVAGRWAEVFATLSQAYLRRCSATCLHRRSLEESRSTMSTADARGEASFHHLFPPGTQSRDTVYCEREVTYLRGLARQKTHVLPCLGLGL